jgi:DNA polymerase-3 subunit delta
VADAAWTPQKLIDAVKRGVIYPLYFLFGDETFLVDEALGQLQAKSMGDGLRDFNYNLFYGSDADASQIRDAIETLPMMAPMRVVVVKEAQDLTEKDWDQLMPLLVDPVKSTVFICVATKVDKRKKFIKRFMDLGVVVEFKRPYENQIPEWIVTIARQHGLRLSREAVDQLHQLVGSDLQDINAEMRKLAQYVGDVAEQRLISVDEVLQIVSRVRVDNVFELTDAIGKKQLDRAMMCLSNLLDHGQNEVGVLALVSRHFRILKLINGGLKEGLSGQRLSARAGVSPYFMNSYLDQAKRWNEHKIDETFHALLETDRALKSSPIASRIWLENFLIHTCS